MNHFHDMAPLENLYYALGELAYAIARADGIVQDEERERFSTFLLNGFHGEDSGVDIASIVFRVMDNKCRDSKTTYDWAINEIRTNSHYLSPRLKDKFRRIMENIAEAYPPVTQAESNLIDRFRRDIAGINGDPLYYENH